jgi:hypothetical protein
MGGIRRGCPPVKRQGRQCFQRLVTPGLPQPVVLLRWADVTDATDSYHLQYESWTLERRPVGPPWVAIPPPSYGGTESVVCELARGLAAAGHEVVLYATGDSTAPVPTVYGSATEPGIGWATAWWNCRT